MAPYQQKEKNNKNKTTLSCLTDENISKSSGLSEKSENSCNSNYRNFQNQSDNSVSICNSPKYDLSDDDNENEYKNEYISRYLKQKNSTNIANNFNILKQILKDIKLNIFIIDDDKLNVILYKKIIEQICGDYLDIFNIHIFYDLSFFSFLEKNIFPDLLITDYHLNFNNNETNGFEIIKKINNKLIKSCYNIIITGDYDIKNITSNDIYIHKILLKPISNEIFKNLINKFLLFKIILNNNKTNIK